MGRGERTPDVEAATRELWAAIRRDMERNLERRWKYCSDCGLDFRDVHELATVALALSNTPQDPKP